jgi:DNA-binding GntR family transcriptional regulator
MYEEASLALGRFPGLDAEGICNYRLLPLAQRYGLHLGLARERVTLTEASATVAKRLAIDTGAPVLNLDRVVFASAGWPVEWRAGHVYLPDKATYTALMK